jgi:hypothetical protein
MVRTKPQQPLCPQCSWRMTCQHIEVHLDYGESGFRNDDRAFLRVGHEGLQYDLMLLCIKRKWAIAPRGKYEVGKSGVE